MRSKKSMRRTGRLYLRKSDWPRAHTALWNKAFKPKIDLFDGGSGAHLSQRTLQQLQYTYGKFLFFLSTEHPQLLKRNPERWLNAKVIAKYAKWQPETCGAMTLSTYLSHLWLALRHLYPRADWRWLLAIGNRIRAQAKPKPEKHYQVTIPRVYKLGIQLMDDALASDKPPTSWRVQTAFRDASSFPCWH